MKKLIGCMVLILIYCVNSYSTEYFTIYNSKVREKPTLKSNTLSVIPANSNVLVIEKTDVYEEINDWKDYWYKIYYDKKFGYVYGALLEARQSEIKRFTILPEYNNAGNYSLYTNDELNISFYYPKEWKLEILKDGTYHRAIIAKMKNTSGIFLSASNSNGQAEGRGGYYGDESKYITSISYIKNKVKIYPNASLYKNGNGLLILNSRNIENVSMEPEFETIWNLYDRFYIFNPESSYHGIIISYERLLNNPYSDLDKNTVKMQNQIYYLLNSLKIPK